MQFTVTFYDAEDGTKPMDPFMDELMRNNPTLHYLLVEGLKKLENSDRHGPPLTDWADKSCKILELRVGRKDIARAFFFFRRGQQIVVTNGYVKKTQKIDEGELEKARKYKADWEARFP